MQPLLLSVIAIFGCREAQLPSPALAQDCSLARIGTIVVNGASVEEVAPIAVLEGTFDDQERTRRVTEVATELLHVRGYPQATIAVARREACGVELEVAVQRGPRFRITQLGFATDDAFPEEQRVAAITDALGTVNAVGGSYVADRMERALANLERRYHESGWIDAVISRPIVSYDQAQGAVTVVVPIQAGSRYRIGSVRARCCRRGTRAGRRRDGAARRRVLRREQGPHGPRSRTQRARSSDRVTHRGCRGSPDRRCRSSPGRRAMRARLFVGVVGVVGLVGLVGLVGVVGCVRPQNYLGHETPVACTKSDPERCASALAERDLIDGDLDAYDDAGLRLYVQGIANRLAVHSQLRHAPRVVISNHDGTYAPYANAIVIGRIAIQKLGSEAELAAVLAHEMAHIEGHHATVSLFGPAADRAWLAGRRDAEGIADERAIALLEHAGYSPSAMPRALRAELEGDDDEHPPRVDRIVRVSALAADRTGFEGRAELLAHLDHMVVGRDTRQGIAVGSAWVVASLGLALELGASDVARSAGDGLELRHGRSTLDAYSIGAPWAKELANRLDRKQSSTTSLGTFTLGIVRERERPEDALDRLEDAVRSTLPQPLPGTWVVIVERCLAKAACGALVLELEARDEQADKRWLGSLRAATVAELRAAQPTRLLIAIATHGAELQALVARCPNPVLATALDDPHRFVPLGGSFKCTDR